MPHDSKADLLIVFPSEVDTDVRQPILMGYGRQIS